MAPEFPILRIWQVNQTDHCGDLRVALDTGPDRLRIRREPDGITIERVAAVDFAWLSALAQHESLAAAIERTQRVEATFDLGTTLHRFIGDGTIAGIGDRR